MKNISIWEDFTGKNFQSLNSDLDVDVLIIGGGITGISILYHLKDSKLKVILCEQNRVGRSVTGKSTGKLTFLQNDLIDKIKNNFSLTDAGVYINSQIYAMRSIVKIINKENIDCDLCKTYS